MITIKLQVEDYIKFKIEIAELLAETYSSNFSISLDEINKIITEKTENLEKFLSDGSAILIGCINETSLIAFAWLYLHEYFGQKRIHVNQIAVAPSFRGKGIGKKMMLEIEKEAIRIEANAIDLYVMESNETAQNLYNSFNFQTEKRYMVKKMKVDK